MKIIHLNGKYGKGKTATVSDEDYEELSQYRWVVDYYGYVIRSAHKDLGKGKLISMHRHVMRDVDAYRIDHIDNNPLNNQRSNLRVATQQENLRNRGAQVNNKSGLKGVCQISSHQRQKTWIAQIKIGNKREHLGYFLTKEEAALAYNQAALEHFGEYAWVNQL